MSFKEEDREMFCPKCGKEIPNGARFCPGCGTDTSLGGEILNAANETVESAARELGSAVQEVKTMYSGQGNTGNADEGVHRLKTDRRLVIWILLTIITFGIYGIFFMHKMARDINEACKDDNETIPGFALYILLVLVTLGIYDLFFMYKLGNRMFSSAPKYGLSFTENGTTVLMWRIFGILLFGIGPFIAMNILIKNSNRICAEYNRIHGF